MEEKKYETEELMPILSTINDKLINIVLNELEKKEVPSKELLDTIQTITLISHTLDLTFKV